MSGFQEQLEKEMDKRGLDKVDAQPSSPSTSSKKKSFFSFGAFLKGLVVGTIFFGALTGWAVFKADDTAKSMQERLASKTTIVERDNAEVYRIGDAQPVLRMPSVDLTNETPKEPPVQSADTQAEKEPDVATVQSKPDKLDNKGPLVAAPVPGLYQSVSEGALPIIRKDDGLTPFDAYKRPFEKKSDKPLLSIVFYDAGLSRKTTEGLLENFPPEVTFAFSPYSADLKLLGQVAREKGHEIWLTLPMETKNYPLDDPGPSTLLVNASVEKNDSRLKTVLASAQGYAGVVSQKDHVFKREDANVNPSIQEIFSRGLAVLDSNPSLYSFVGDIASKNDYPNVKNNFWLDEDLSPLALNQKIRQMIDYGKSGGSLVVILRPYPASVKALQKFLHSAAADTFQLAPVSAQVRYGE